jgi:hypothetical protein
MKTHISEKTKWIASDGWRGYVQPINAVGGCNHTGAWDDSPCPTNVVRGEIGEFKAMLKKAKIQHKVVACKTSNVFCQHVYVLVHPEDKETAFQLAEQHAKNTRLFYSVK